MEYRIIRGYEIDGFAQEVQDHLQNGWSLHGDLMVEYGLFIQAVFKDNPFEKCGPM